MIENKRTIQRLWRKPSDMWQISVNKDELITRNIINISPSGLSFKAPPSLGFEKGQVLNLKFNLTPDRSFDVHGQVVWKKENRFGIKFSKIPQVFDTFIMAAIQEAAIHARWEAQEKESFYGRAAHLREYQRQLEQSRLWSSAMGLFVVGVMTAAFALSIFINQTKYPELQLSAQLEKSFDRYMKLGPGK